MRGVLPVGLTLACLGWMAAPGAARGGEPAPNVLLVTVDTLRADRLSSYGYPRATSPAIDRLLAAGARFTEARTVEPLTAPALASMLTSLPPHEHASTRNGLQVRPDRASLPRIRRRHGYRAAAFVGNWTLTQELWGLGSHFEDYRELLNRRRWFGLVKGEATAEDLNAEALAWLEAHRREHGERPFLLWVHYVEPHAPYRLQREFTDQIGAAPDGDRYSSSNRYDSEIAYVDHHISRLLEAVAAQPAERTLVAFASDHGESLGEHGYWGHGRHVYDVTLRIPLGFTWPGRIVPQVIDAPALIVDLAPTVLGLLGHPVPSFFQGRDWSAVLRGEARPAPGRVTYYQAHRGVTTPKEDATRARQRGLLEVARIEGTRKEILRVTNNRRRLFDLATDAYETTTLTPTSPPNGDLLAWLDQVRAGLALADHLPPPSLTEEDVEALRALGYVD